MKSAAVTACLRFAAGALPQPSQPSFSPANISAPVSTPADSIQGLAVFGLAVTAAIFAVVFGLLVYSVVKFRKGTNDDSVEPPQIYGSNQVELAWTIIPF